MNKDGWKTKTGKERHQNKVNEITNEKQGVRNKDKGKHVDYKIWRSVSRGVEEVNQKCIE